MESSQPQLTQRISIRLPHDIYQRLCEKSVREGLSVAELAKALLEQAVLEQNLQLTWETDAPDA